MSRHGDKFGPQRLKIHGLAAGGLGGVQNKGHTAPAAQVCDFLRRQNIAEHIGNVVKNNGLHFSGKLLFKLAQNQVRPEQGRSCHLDGHALDGGQRPGDGIVLIARDQHRVPRLYQCVDGDVQPVGRVIGEYHVFRLGHVKQLCGRLPAGQGGLRRLERRLMPSPARACKMIHGIRNSPGDAGRLLQGCGGAVEINHTSTSR
ncbi:hypothetical protein SDC9_113514 [bioreactor metagenome]|uniref:Uncharacterized protein n=1 Tax=bioreactor metagenome TaxID=1076179 RepID=A0A645BY19_9ZZZZ